MVKLHIVDMWGEVSVDNYCHAPVGLYNWVGAFVSNELIIHMRLDKGEIHAFCFLDEGHSNVVFPHVLLQASVFLYCRAGGCTPDVEADEVEDRVCGCRAFSWVSFGGVESYLCPSSPAFAAASWLSLAASDPFDPVGLGSPAGPVS